ncbi:MAG: PIN domain-containing protein [Saprospiraceae bacterium]
MEVLVKPIRENKHLLVQQYRDILTTADGIEILEINSTIAENAAHIRAKYNLRTPDAIQLGAAIESHCDYFLTHDRRLRGIDEIRVLYLDEIK